MSHHITHLPGGVHGMPMDAYHAHPSLSHSLCRWLEPEMAPLQFWYRSWHNPSRPTDRLRGSHVHTGNLMHAALENFEAFISNIVVLPQVQRTSRAGCIGGAPGGQLEALQVLRARLLAMPWVAQAMEEGRPEVSYFATCQGVPIRCRPDLETDDLEIHWKFVSRMEYLGNLMERLRYLEGLAWYRRVRRELGLPDRRQIMVLCQTYAPWEIRVIEPSAYFLDEAAVYGQRVLLRYRQLLYGPGPWPDHAETPQDVCHATAGGGQHAIALPPSYERRLAA
jgi:hypothetical protein